MKGDFTRDTFKPENHYGQVLMQQGRVQIDADSNEQGAIVAHRDETTIADRGPLRRTGGRRGVCAVRQPGAKDSRRQGRAANLSEGSASTAARPSKCPASRLPNRATFSSAGRYYVDGIRRENEIVIP